MNEEKKNGVYKCCVMFHYSFTSFTYLFQLLTYIYSDYHKL